MVVTQSFSIYCFHYLLTIERKRKCSLFSCDVLERQEGKIFQKKKRKKKLLSSPPLTFKIFLAITNNNAVSPTQPRCLSVGVLDRRGVKPEGLSPPKDRSLYVAFIARQIAHVEQQLLFSVQSTLD